MIELLTNKTVTIGSILVGLITNFFQDKIDNHIDKKKINKFKKSIEDWADQFEKENPNTIISSDNFFRYLKYQKLIESIFDYVLNANCTVSKQEFSNNLLADIKNNITSIIVTDEPVVKEFISKIIEKCETFAQANLSITDKNIIYFIEENSNKNRDQIIQDVNKNTNNVGQKILELLPKNKTKPCIKNECQEPKEYTIQRTIISCNDLSENSFNYLDSDKTITLLDAVKQYNYIVLLGDAGDGKSLELSQLAYELSKSDDNIFPIKYNLNKYVGESIDELIPENYISVPKKNLLFILDGFDEIQEKDINDFKRYIEKYCEDNPDTKFVISSRTNFYRQPNKENNFDGTIKNFKTFLICQLTNDDIEDYVISQHIDYKSFITELNYNNLIVLAHIPFYLNKLVDLYSKNKELPARNNLMKALIKRSFCIDINKYTKTYDIQMEEYDLTQILIKLGFSVQCLGKNYLKKDEYQKLFNKKYRILLRYSGIWSKYNDQDWQFIHNNFGEYLAAEYLAEKSLSEIIFLITYSIDHTIIKPKWVNTLSYLTSLYKGSALLEWLTENAPQMLIKFEKNRISEPNKLFKDIVETYSSKMLWIDLDVRKDLIRFGECRDTLEYLLNNIQSSTNNQLIINSSVLLYYFEKTHGLAAKITEVLAHCIININDEFIINRCLLVLSKFKLQNKELTDQLVKKFNINTESYIRYGMYVYLHTSQFLDENINFFIEGFQYYYANNRVGNESFELLTGIKKITDKKAFDKIIKYLMKDDIVHKLYTSDYLLKSILFAANNISKDHKTFVFNRIYELVPSIIHGYTGKKLLIDYLDQTKTRVKTFIKIAKDNQYKFLLDEIADNNCINEFIKEYKKGEICNETAIDFAHYLNNQNHPNFNNLNNEIELKTGKKIPKKVFYDYEKIIKEGAQKYFDALFDKDKFNELVNEILKIRNNQQLKVKDLSDHNFKRINQRHDLELVKWTINRNFDNKDAFICNLFKEINWKDFSIFQIYEQLKGENNTAQVSHKQIEYIKKYFYQKISEINLCTYSTIGYILIYFMIYFKFECNEKVYLDMITFPYSLGSKIDDNSKNLIEYVSKLVDSQKFSQQIIDNLNNKNLGGIIYENHIQYCIDYKIYDVVEIAKQVSIDATRDMFVKQKSIDYLVMLIENDELNKDEFYHDVAQKVDDKILLYVADKVYTYKDNELIRIIIDRVKDSDLIDQLMVYLIYMNNDTGIDYYINLLKKSMKTPSESSIGDNMTRAIETIEDIDKLPQMLQLLDILFDEEFKDCEFESLSSNLQKALLLMGEKNPSNYDQVRSKLTARLSNPQIKENEIRFINFTLDWLKTSYLENNEIVLTIDEVKKLMKEFSD